MVASNTNTRQAAEGQKTAKAKVAKADDKGKAVAETEFEVQFNPSTLRMQTRVNADGGTTKGRPARSKNGTNTVTLSVELIFDTSDDGTIEDPLDVQSLTAQFRRFVEPQAEDSKKPPDPIWFHWGKFTFTGIVESMDEELEYFSFYGVALRAKLTLSIKQQDFKHEANSTGAGARGQEPAQGRTGSSGNNANSQQDNPPGLPGSTGDSRGDNTAEALGGESAADFAERNGLPAAAWRAITNGSIANPLSLPAGLEVPFPSSINIGGTVSVRLGATAGVDLTVEAAARATIGIGDETKSSSGSASGRPDLHKISAVGGLAAAVETLAGVEAAVVADAERVAHPTPIVDSGTGAAISAAASKTSRAPVPRAAAELPIADRRSLSFGRGVPLRAATQIARTARPNIGTRGSGQNDVRQQRSAAEPPWESLPTTTNERANSVQQQRRSTTPCGCCKPPGPNSCDCKSSTKGGN